MNVVPLRDKGSRFDVASTHELDRLLSLDIAASRCSFGNTIKKSRDIRYFHEQGVRLFATDSESDLRNIARSAPGSKVYVRILTEGSGTADWPLSHKFGCHTEMAIELLTLARGLGLEPGRSLIANAGILVTEVVLVARKSHTSLHRWVYTDAGKFSGLIETLDEAIRFPAYTASYSSVEFNGFPPLKSWFVD